MMNDVFNGLRRLTELINVGYLGGLTRRNRWHQIVDVYFGRIVAKYVTIRAEVIFKINSLNFRIQMAFGRRAIVQAIKFSCNIITDDIIAIAKLLKINGPSLTATKVTANTVGYV